MGKKESNSVGGGLDLLGLPSWLLVIPVVASLIFLHELGHFILAKRFGIKVTEFGFGIPPRIVGFRYGETLYSLNWIPFGGFVRMMGMGGEDDSTHPRSFGSRNGLQRILILLAGPLVNLLLPIVVFTVMFLLPHDIVVGTVSITGVAPGSPAENAGLRAGDVILEANGSRVRNHIELVQEIMVSLGDDVNLAVRRGTGVVGLNLSQEYASVENVQVRARLNPPTLKVVADVHEPNTEVALKDARIYDSRLKIGDTLTQGSIGIMVGTTNAKTIEENHPVWEAIPLSFNKMWDVLITLKNVFARWFGGGPAPIGGPIGIAQVTGEVAKTGISPMFELIALLSISLGVLNLLPIPPLDGGRIALILLEGIRGGRRISQTKEQLVILVGLTIVVGLLIALPLYLDVTRLLNGEELIR